MEGGTYGTPTLEELVRNITYKECSMNKLSKIQATAILEIAFHINLAWPVLNKISNLHDLLRDNYRFTSNDTKSLISKKLRQAPLSIIIFQGR